MNRIHFQLCLGLSIAIAINIAACPASADARTDYLINMLEKGSNYRIRVQAATTLGKLRSTEAVPALVRALKDEHELVVVSVATALGKIGDTSVISKVETECRSTRSAAARSQLEATLRILRALSPDGSQSTVVDQKPRYFIRVDAMGNSSGVGRKDIVEILRDIVLQRVKREPGVEMQDPNMTNLEIKKNLKKKKLKGFILSGSLIKMEIVDNKLIVKIGLNVFTNPDYNLLMMPTAEGSISISSGPMTNEGERAAQNKAIKAVADRLIGSIFRKFQQMENP
ncbi:MAG: HEAT repeat domain-containing protein [Proteobacteria bacterium]|nr:HEAT repeat domain-containing protein [Pseudomonadota bacterium]